MSKKVPELLREKIETFEEKGKEYGHSYTDYGAVAKALFKNTKHPTTEKEWNEFGIFNMMIHKMMRLANGSFTSLDSVRDIQVYAAMLEEVMIDREEVMPDE